MITGTKDIVISANGLRFAYPQSTFELVIPSIAIRHQEKLAIVGPSGSGKTTLLNLFSGILRPDAGQMTILNETIVDYTEKALRRFRVQNIGFVFQDFKLLEYLTVEDNILLPFRINSGVQNKKPSLEVIKEFLAKVGLEHKLKAYPKQLSYGQQQRVAICRALITQPKLIFADEPTGNLDPKAKKQILDILFEQVQYHHATLLTVTHDHELLPYFDRIIDFKKYINNHEG